MVMEGEKVIENNAPSTSNDRRFNIFWLNTVNT